MSRRGRSSPPPPDTRDQVAALQEMVARGSAGAVDAASWQRAAEIVRRLVHLSTTRGGPGGGGDRSAAGTFRPGPPPAATLGLGPEGDAAVTAVLRQEPAPHAARTYLLAHGAVRVRRHVLDALGDELDAQELLGVLEVAADPSLWMRVLRHPRHGAQLGREAAERLADVMPACVRRHASGWQARVPALAPSEAVQFAVGFARVGVARAPDGHRVLVARVGASGVRPAGPPAGAHAEMVDGLSGRQMLETLHQLAVDLDDRALDLQLVRATALSVHHDLITEGFTDLDAEQARRVWAHVEQVLGDPTIEEIVRVALVEDAAELAGLGSGRWMPVAPGLLPGPALTTATVGRLTGGLGVPPDVGERLSWLASGGHVRREHLAQLLAASDRAVRVAALTGLGERAGVPDAPPPPRRPGRPG